MKHFLIIIGLFVVITAKGQEIKTIDFLSDIKRIDISELWTVEKLFWEFEGNKDSVDRNEPLGYIGDNYQRFYIHFISVIKNPENPLEYFVYGKSKVKSNVCEFQGIISIKVSQIYTDIKYPDLKTGYVTAVYKLFENSKNKGSGILSGVCKSNFYIGKTGKLNYNSLGFYSDGFKNNQFEGKWTNYQTGESKKCNWGDYRIPDSRELDIGAGEFSVDDKYLKMGWEIYKNIISTDEEKSLEARKTEELKWWLENK